MLIIRNISKNLLLINSSFVILSLKKIQTIIKKILRASTFIGKLKTTSQGAIILNWKFIIYHGPNKKSTHYLEAQLPSAFSHSPAPELLGLHSCIGVQRP